MARIGTKVGSWVGVTPLATKNLGPLHRVGTGGHRLCLQGLQMKGGGHFCCHYSFYIVLQREGHELLAIGNVNLNFDFRLLNCRSWRHLFPAAYNHGWQNEYHYGDSDK